VTAVEDRLAEIEKLANAATEGPWRVTPWHDKGVMPAGWADDSLPIDERGPFAHIAASDLLDAAFIAAARTDVPVLSAALQAVLAKCTETSETWSNRVQTGDDSDDRWDAKDRLARDLRDVIANALGVTL